MQLEFFVPGIPQPGGSKRAFRHFKTGKIIVLDDAKGNKSWRSTVTQFAYVACTGTVTPFVGPVILEVSFVMPRPRGHFGTGKNADKLKPSAPKHHTVKPDATKMLRAVEDALTGLVWRDDAQVVVQHVRKDYGDKPGALIRVREERN